MTPILITLLHARAAMRAIGVSVAPRRIPRAQYPHLLEVEYGRLLRGQVGIVKARIAAIESALVHGAPADAIAALEVARRELAAQVPALRRRLAALAVQVLDFQARQLDAQTRAALGVPAAALGVTIHATIPGDFHADAKAKAQSEDDRINGWVTENVALIKDLGDKPLAQIEQLVTRSYASGDRSTTLAQNIVETTGLAENRATLIARDQIGKLNGRVSADRHQKLGLTRFIWRDVGDRRVRADHRRLNGQTFTYASPPSEGLPGEPILCRCHDEPIFDDVLDALDKLEAAAPTIAPALPTAKPARRRAAPAAPAPVVAPPPPPAPVVKAKAPKPAKAVKAPPPAPVAAPPAPPAPPKKLTAAQKAAAAKAEALAAIEAKNAAYWAAKKAAPPPPAAALPRYRKLERTPAAEVVLDKGAERFAKRTNGGIVDGKFTPEAQKEIHEHVNGVLDSYGFKVKDVYGGLTQFGEINLHERAAIAGNNGDYNQGTGEIRLAIDIGRNVGTHAGLTPAERVDIGARMKADRDAKGAHDYAFDQTVTDFRTVVHEYTHGRGILLSHLDPAYTVLEEVSTEVSARRVVADLHKLESFRMAGSYDHYIDPVVDHVAAVAKIDRDKAYLAVEHASMQLKRKDDDHMLDPYKQFEIFSKDALEHAGVKDKTANEEMRAKMYEIAKKHGKTLDVSF